MSCTLNDPRLPQKFWDNVRVTENGCWLWLGWCDGNGYPRLDTGTNRENHKCVYAQRYANEQLVGPIPKGFLKATCRVMNCVLPDHRYSTKSRYVQSPILAGPSPKTHTNHAIEKMRVANEEKKAAADRHGCGIETCWICQLAVLCLKGKWYDDVGKEHCHQPGALGRQVVLDMAAAGAKGRYGRKPKATEEEGE